MREIAVILIVTSLGLPMICGSESQTAVTLADESNRPRLIILADMGNEPDEEQQMTHMLVNCSEFELEGLIAVTGKFLNENADDPFKRVVHPELFHKLIDGYAHVEANLRLHCDGWPTAEYLHSIVEPGQAKYGLADVGEGKSTKGSQLIMRAIEKKDPRPLNIVVNAGSNTLAQALIDLRASHANDEFKAMIRKLRVFENGAQDNCGAWICHEFPAIHWIRSNHQTYGYMGQARNREAAAGPYCWKPYPRTHQGQHRWAEKHIMRDHGALGELYPYRFGGNGFLEGGGTIPWLGFVNKGLYDVDHPSWGGWSGRFTSAKQKNVWSRHASVRKDEEGYGDFFAYTEAADRWSDPDEGTVYQDDFAPVWRWRQAMLNNCQARFDWCVKSFVDANHHPVAAVNGDKTDSMIRYRASAEETLTVDASDSFDPDGDKLFYRWYFYPEAGSYPGELSHLKGARSQQCSFKIPPDSVGQQIHLILEVVDDSDVVSLTDYRRIVVDVEQRIDPSQLETKSTTRPNVLMIITDDMNDYGVGKECDRPVSAIDLLPTLRDFCSLADTQHELDGQSIRSLLVDPATEWPRAALTAYGENMFSVRSERYRYIRYADGSEELYDHDADLHEWKNLAEFPETKAIRTELKAMLPATSARSLGGRDG